MSLRFHHNSRTRLQLRKLRVLIGVGVRLLDRLLGAVPLGSRRTGLPGGGLRQHLNVVQLHCALCAHGIDAEGLEKDVDLRWLLPSPSRSQRPGPGGSKPHLAVHADGMDRAELEAELLQLGYVRRLDRRPHGLDAWGGLVPRPVPDAELLRVAV